MNLAAPPSSDESSLQRQVRGFWGLAIAAIAISFSVFQLYQSGFGLMPPQNLRAIHLAFALGLVFLLYPPLKSWAKYRLSVVDVLLAAAAIAGPLYFHFNFHAMVSRAGAETPLDLAVGLLTIVALLEATRRALGPVLPLFAALFVVYAYVGPYMPELIAHRGYSPERIIRHLYPTTEGIFGTPLGVASTFVFLFVLFGAVMRRTGIADYLNRIAISGLGGFQGGPAKAAVLASALMGSFSGSSTANVATTGTLTIPLMIRVGFRPASAGGVETAASTTGQFVPPVMGAAAFVMVEMTGISYVEIIQAALLPAMLDLAGIIFCVHMHALKMKIRGLPRAELPPFLPTLFSQIYLLIPIFGLIFLLVIARFTPTMSAFWAIPLALLVSFVARNTVIVWHAVSAHLRGENPFAGAEARLEHLRSSQEVPSRDEAEAEARRGALEVFGKTWFDWARDFIRALEDGARQAIPISIACATAGIIIGVISLTGLGLRMQSILLTLSGGELWAALIFTAIGSIVLGLGVPTTANYIIMATLMAPALVQMGVPLLAAHMFVFYFGILADATPPVGLGAYVAAGIARAGPIRTAMEGFKFSITAFIIPFMFVYNPVLLLMGEIDLLRLGWVVASGLIGVYALSVMKEGWWRTRASAIERVIMTVAALLLIHPSLFVDLTGFVLMGAVYLWQTRKVRLEARHGERRPGLAQRVLTGTGIVGVPAAAGALFLPVVAVDHGGERWSHITHPGARVTLSHIHSVERTLVADEFQVGWRAELIHVRSLTRSFGAGLPTDGVLEGRVVTTPGTGDRHRTIPLRFEAENDPRLRIGGDEVTLPLREPQGRIELRVEHLWERLWPLRDAGR